MNYPGNADYLRIKTSDCKPILVNHNVGVHIYAKDTDGVAYDYHYYNQNCTITKGYALSGRVVNQVQVYIVPYSENMTSCTLAITATEG